ncbi:MAG: GMC family oxidoreductase [Nitrospirota bacterium]
MVRDFDVVVIGAGVAGAMVGYRLAQAGAGVLILEAGSRNPSRAQMVGAYGTAPIKSLHSPFENAETDNMAPSPDSSPTYYDQPPDPHTQYKSTYERRTGGSTWHWLGHTPRMLRTDFRMKSEYGGGPNFPPAMVDWPISYDDLEPWYCEAEREMGVAGSDEEWNGLFNSPRSKPFPMSMIWPSYSDTWISERINGKKFEGAEYRVRSTPSARNSQLYDGRPPCAGNSICVPVCPIGAKYDGSVHVAKATAAGASLWEQCVVTKLDKDADGAVHTIHFVTYGGVSHFVTTELIVVAAHAIETPKLLLMSNLANSSDSVGRYLMDHLSKSTFGLAPEKLFPFRGPPSTSGIESFRDGDFRRERAGFRLSLNNDGWSRKRAPYAEIIDLVTNQHKIGAELQTALFDRVTRQVRLSCSVEVAPDANNRVELSSTTDALKLPHPKITFTPPDYSYRGLAQAIKTLADMFRLIDATEVDLGTDNKAYDGAGHIMGTCRMGNDPKSAVVDAQSRTHDHRNLFIVGSSVFPTVGSPNPTLTIAALALRAAQDITTQLGLKPKPQNQP